AFNAFAIWNVGGALERAVRPADYLALIIFTALSTTVASAVGADSISLGASGIAFGVLGASATFGWRRAVRGRLRAHFGLRLLPWLFALFLAGLGSAGVDNWGHGGGLVAGRACGRFRSARRGGAQLVAPGGRGRAARGGCGGPAARARGGHRARRRDGAGRGRAGASRDGLRGTRPRRARGAGPAAVVGTTDRAGGKDRAHGAVAGGARRALSGALPRDREARGRRCAQTD